MRVSASPGDESSSWGGAVLLRVGVPARSTAFVDGAGDAGGWTGATSRASRPAVRSASFVSKGSALV